jgi:hypothetical protein
LVRTSTDAAGALQTNEIGFAIQKPNATGRPCKVSRPACTLARGMHCGATVVEQGRWIVLSAALIAATGWAADKHGSLLDLKVRGMQRVDQAQYANASALALRGGTPFDIALTVAGAFEGSIQHVIQVNETSEAPSASRVTVLRDGLLDDSIRGERWDISLERTSAGAWRIREVKRAWRCWRGEEANRFAATACP